MIIPIVAICPICGKKTYIRITNGGYLKEYPIRFQCANCRALIKGKFTISSPYNGLGLHLYNANTEECDVDPVSNKILNADYIVDISGELPCKKVRAFDGNIISSSPFLETTYQVDMLERIERLKYFEKNMEEWKAWRSIAFQLLDEGSIDYICTALQNRMGDYSYQCDNYLKSLHCLQEVVQEETKNLFFIPNQNDCISSLLRELTKVGREELHLFAEQIGGVQEMIAAYKRVINIFSEFMDIYPNVLPAETFIRFRRRGETDVGIATCSFGDIKAFYQDAYETIMSLVSIPVCLDNITLRNDYQAFNEVFNKYFSDWKYSKLPDNYSKYVALDSGLKLEKLQSSEPLQQLLNIPANRFLRNGIGHNNVRYDGLTQTITVLDQKNPSKIKLTESLMDMAVDCIGLVKATVLMAEILLFIIRQEARSENIHSIIHPRFYIKVGPNDKCPCGSGIKFKKCCKSEIDHILYNPRLADID
jgi:hypothetical protein